ncbi:Putative antitoxin [Psychrobacter phage D'Alembert]|nr:Putative antitoxin [Psychrobacter phage D'Alembert]
MAESSDMDETKYLLSSESNREHLERSIEQTGIKNTSYVDSDMVVRLMEDMTISELKVLKSACDLLIGFRSNE